jgi:N-acylneuraminate cytidylyltransferase
MRQNLKLSDIIFRENGSIYITKLHILLKEKNRLGGKISIFEMKEEEGHEIDSLNDFNLVKDLILKLNEFKKKIFISNVSAIVFDFDGVLTNNKVYVSEKGEETVRCDRGDGFTFELLKKLGLKIFILSSEKNSVVKMRAKKLNIDLIYGSKNKKNDLKELCKKHSLDLKKLVYVGNDINDLEAMKVCGFSFAVADAVKEIKKVADFVLESKGGEMVAREIFNNFIER